MNKTQLIECMNNRKLGKFEIHYDFITEYPDDFLEIMKNIIIVKCKNKKYSFKYTAYSHLFYPLSGHNKIPNYIFSFHEGELLVDINNDK